MKVVVDSSDIEKYQMKLKSKFFFGADKKPKPVLSWKSPAGKVPYEVNYLSSLRIWSCYMLNPQGSTRHWNGFGVGEPASGKATTIDLTIPFAVDKDGKDQNGVFVENANGEILICHTGNVYRSKDLFWDKFTGQEITIDNEDETKTRYAYVANLSSPECLHEIASFVKMVKMMKKK